MYLKLSSLVTLRVTDFKMRVHCLQFSFLFLKQNMLWVLVKSILKRPIFEQPGHMLKLINKIIFTVKHVLSGHSKIVKTKVLKTNGSLMKVESIAECSLGAFCNTFDLN